MNGTSWTYNPLCIKKIGSRGNRSADEVSNLLKKLFEGHASKEPTELLVIAAAQGNTLISCFKPLKFGSFTHHKIENE